MITPKNPPMEEYTIKLLLLEAMRCYRDADFLGLVWIETRMFRFNARIRELKDKES